MSEHPPSPAPPVALVGPTASGKSALALALARRRPAFEIVSVDSMQVYRGMDIGTAKPTPAERAEIRHHLIDLVDADEEYTVARFQADVHAAVADIERRGRRALLVGGTGLYLQAAVDDLDIPGQYPEVRAALEADADTVGLHHRLAGLDPVAAARMEPTNRRRVVRALEVTLGSGRPFSSFGPGLAAYPPTRFLLVGLRLPRPVLDARIAARYRDQLDDGFLDEVRALAARPGGLSRTAAQALGYKELLDHLAGAVTLDDALERAVTRTRRFARRQERWFRRDPRIRWLEPPPGSGDDPLRALDTLRALVDDPAPLDDPDPVRRRHVAPAAPSGEQHPPPVPASFTDVDGEEQDQDRLVAMMDATDAWPAVQAARAWVLDRARLGVGSTVVDIGCGPGTFATLARAAARAVRTVEVDRSAAMLRVVAARHGRTRTCRADVGALPLHRGVAALVHLERVLQWSADPHAALTEARRIVAPGGALAVTDTDWRTFTVEHPDPAVSTRLSAAALAWVPHAALAGSLGERLRDLGFDHVEVRRDLVLLDAWDPDDPAQFDGPPGLPLHSIAAAGTRGPDRLSADVATLAQAARVGRFRASLTIVTAVGRCLPPATTSSPGPDRVARWDVRPWRSGPAGRPMGP
ncbi:MAG: tRNA (adenosine(37)-N6)-dimethylallyltransferase MiaA [Acidimicrobiales bacterium]|nr:tRNA (adenosine(37)-N6)-dimethylallyltransferase MiaA [Acidimicrobiales bacterium]